MTQTIVVVWLDMLVRICGTAFAIGFAGLGVYCSASVFRKDNRNDASSNGDVLGIGCFALFAAIALCGSMWFETLPK
jgi:hypothetical protein